MAQDEPRLKSVSVRVTSHAFFLMHLANVFTPHLGSRCLSAHFTPSTCHPSYHMFERAFLVSSCLSLSCFSPSSTSSLPHSACSLPGTPSLMSSPPWVQTTALTQNESIAPWRYTILSQVMSPSSSTTSTTQRLLQRSSRMNPAT